MVSLLCILHGALKKYFYPLCHLHTQYLWEESEGDRDVEMENRSSRKHPLPLVAPGSRGSWTEPPPLLSALSVSQQAGSYI